MSNQMPELAGLCASEHCRDERLPGRNFCYECESGVYATFLERKSAVEHGNMPSESTGSLPQHHQDAILAQRKKREEKRRIGEQLSEDQLQKVLDHKQITST